MSSLREGVPDNRIRVIHNWADDLKNSKHGMKGNEMRKKWGVEEKFVIGYSGNIGRAHEFGTLLDAAELLLKKNRLYFSLHWRWCSTRVDKISKKTTSFS